MNFLKLAILLIILSTITSTIIKPQIHKPVRVENADFVLTVTSEQPKPATNTLTKHIETLKTQTPPTPKDVQTEKKTTPTQPVPISKKIEPTPVKPQETKQEVKTDPPVQVQKEPKKATKKLTPEEEEIIAWNEWRSNLQNKVMKDVILYAPVGTRFEFSFTVDKFGNISNLKVWSKNPQYTDMAVKKIKPVIQGYQGQSILNFPEKSKRVITNVNGGFSIARTSRYSKPSDYSDYEKIKK